MENSSEDGPRLTLVEHLGELRKRLVISFVAIIICAFAAYRYINKIIDIITKPAGDLEFIYLSPPELFMTYIKISLVLGLIISSPIILFQIWSFVKPGLKKKERRYVISALLMGTIFLMMGVVFAYYIIVPMTIKFFTGVTVDKITPTFSFANYIGFVSSLLLSFGLVFELPLLIILLTRLGLVSPKTLRKYRKYVILVIFIVSAILTPPDVVSQILMAIPMTFLYEFSIIVSTMIYKKKKKKKGIDDENDGNDEKDEKSENDGNDEKDEKAENDGNGESDTDDENDISDENGTDDENDIKDKSDVNDECDTDDENDINDENDTDDENDISDENGTDDENDIKDKSDVNDECDTDDENDIDDGNAGSDENDENDGSDGP